MYGDENTEREKVAMQVTVKRVTTFLCFDFESKHTTIRVTAIVSGQFVYLMYSHCSELSLLAMFAMFVSSVVARVVECSRLGLSRYLL